MYNRKELKKKARAALGNNIFSNNWMTSLLVIFVESAICAAAGSILPAVGGLILVGPLVAGKTYYFIKQSRNEEKRFTDLFHGFDIDFGGTFLLGLMKSLFEMLWSLLFVIPGIIKSYAYSMAFYIKCDYPEKEWRECLKLSEEMTKGHKWDLFVLSLSFIGWYFVGSLVLGVGSLWVMAYETATKAEYYNQLKVDKEYML